MGLLNYTGIGSRDTPHEILDIMSKFGKVLNGAGFTLRSGGAPGADVAFERLVLNKKDIFLPWRGFNCQGRPTKEGIALETIDPMLVEEAKEISKRVHPVWGKLTAGAQKLHTRNVFQILGEDLKTPSLFVIYWAPVTKSGNVKGGTATAVNLAKEMGIPTFNLLEQNVLEEIVTNLNITME